MCLLGVGYGATDSCRFCHRFHLFSTCSIPPHSCLFSGTYFRTTFVMLPKDGCSFFRLPETCCSGINILNLDWFDWFSLECLYDTNFHTNLLLSTIGPFVFVAFICSLLLGRLLISRRLNPVNPSYTMRDMQKNMIFVCLVVAFLVFSPTSTTVFQTFVCEVRRDSSRHCISEVNLVHRRVSLTGFSFPWQDFPDGQRLLVADYSIDCNSAIHKAYEGFAGFMVSTECHRAQAMFRSPIELTVLSGIRGRLLCTLLASLPSTWPC